MVFLVGFMGSGKTTLGRKLAKRMQLPFLDLDARLVERLGMDIPTFFKNRGEEAFRLHEKEALLELETTQPAVVSTGGGAPCFHENMRWMNQHGTTVYLRLPAKVLWQRLMQSDLSSRPLLQGRSEEALYQYVDNSLRTREPYYLQARIQIDPLRESLDDIVEKCRLHNK